MSLTFVLCCIVLCWVRPLLFSPDLLYRERPAFYFLDTRDEKNTLQRIRINRDDIPLGGRRRMSVVFNGAGPHVPSTKQKTADVLVAVAAVRESGRAVRGVSGPRFGVDVPRGGAGGRGRLGGRVGRRQPYYANTAAATTLCRIIQKQHVPMPDSPLRYAVFAAHDPPPSGGHRCEQGARREYVERHAGHGDARPYLDAAVRGRPHEGGSAPTGRKRLGLGPGRRSVVYGGDLLAGSSEYVGAQYRAAHATHMQHMGQMTDQMYFKHMIPHHQVAIDMSKLLIKHTTNDFMMHLAYRIIRAQEGEIKLLYDLQFSPAIQKRKPIQFGLL
jgi:hypothetical protein